MAMVTSFLPAKSRQCATLLVVLFCPSTSTIARSAAALNFVIPRGCAIYCCSREVSLLELSSASGVQRSGGTCCLLSIRSNGSDKATTPTCHSERPGFLLHALQRQRMRLSVKRAA